MRGVPILTVVLGLCAFAGPLRAGVYNTMEEPELQPVEPCDAFHANVLAPLRQIGIADKDAGTKAAERPFQKRHRLVGELCGRGTPTNLSVEQRLDLSGYLIRLRKYQEAIAVLAPLKSRGSESPAAFLAFSNLATAEALAGQAGDRDMARRASPDFDAALALWPEKWDGLPAARRKWLEEIGWHPDKFAWYRRAETYLQKLLRLRAEQARRPPARDNLLGEEIEPLFDDGGKPPRPVRFVGEGGRYAAGKIAKAEKDKLPSDDVKIVEQLLIWMPDDQRLEWLLGELLNARGEVISAAAVFEDVKTKLTSIAKARNPFAVVRLPRLHSEHLETVRTAAAAAKVAAAKALLEGPAPPAKGPDRPPPPPVGGNPPDKVTSGGSLPIDLRSLAVGFGGGLLFAILGLWQIREIRRRRQARMAPSRS